MSLLVPVQALALTPTQWQSIDGNTEYYTGEGTSTAGSGGGSGSCSSTGGTTETVPSGTLPSLIPEPYNGAFTEGANAHNVSPALVAALFSEENGLGGNEVTPDITDLPLEWATFAKEHPNPNSGWPTSSSDAEGPFQFLPSTWTSLGYNIADINDLVTASNAAADYAATDSATVGASNAVLSTFIYSYNHADWYVAAVLQYYNYYSSQPASTPSGGSTTLLTGSSQSCQASCSNGGVVSGNIAQTAICLAWPDETHGTTPTPAYAAALQEYNPSEFTATNGLGTDCGAFVATVMRATGVDPNYPAVSTVAQAEYVIANPNLYQIIYPATSTSQLQVGDILIINEGTTQNANGTINVGQEGGAAGGHTFIYVGPQAPNGYNEASASYPDRAAGLGTAQLQDPLGRGNYLIARFK